jgi:hypothetical protein
LVGLAVLALTLYQRTRSGRPSMRFPRPTGAQTSTLLAWLIIAVLVYVALTRR